MDPKQHKAINQAAERLPDLSRLPFERKWWNNRVLDNNSAGRISEWCGVSIRTARRWKQTGDIPNAMQKLAELYMDGRVRPSEGHWNNWVFSSWKGRAILTNGKFHLADHELETYFMVFDHRRLLERQLKEAQAKIRRLEKATAQMQLFEEEKPELVQPPCDCCYCAARNG